MYTPTNSAQETDSKASFTYELALDLGQQAPLMVALAGDGPLKPDMDLLLALVTDYATKARNARLRGADPVEETGTLVS